MKRIFLYAYDKVNLGDDLFIRYITNKYQNTKFYMVSDKKNKRNFSDCSNLKILNKESCIKKNIDKIHPSIWRRYELKIKKRCNAIVYIGGSIFIEYPSWRDILNWWKYHSDNFKFYVLGANFGPYKTEAYRIGLKEALSNAEDVCLRDQYSFEKLQGSKNIRYAPDILFSYELPKVDKIKKQVFVSVINCATRGGEHGLVQYEKQYMEMISSILCEYLQNDYLIKLVSFCEEEGDLDAAYKIYKILEKEKLDKKIEIVSYNGQNYNEVLKSLAESECVIASRFHAVILSLVAERPVFPIVYSDKTINVLQDIGFEGEYADIRKLNVLDYKCLKQNVKKATMIDEKMLKEKSQEHFEKLNKLII